LRQGDPLSPLLFVLVMEYLSRLYHHAGTKEGFNFHPNCKESKLNHLIFTDDLIVFSAADPRTIYYLMEAFDKFSKSTGLEANKDKSQIVLGDVKNNIRSRLLIKQGIKREAPI